MLHLSGKKIWNIKYVSNPTQASGNQSLHQQRQSGKLLISALLYVKNPPFLEYSKLELSTNF